MKKPSATSVGTVFADVLLVSLLVVVLIAVFDSKDPIEVHYINVTNDELKECLLYTQGPSKIHPVN